MAKIQHKSSIELLLLNLVQMLHKSTSARHIAKAILVAGLYKKL
jgi:hypothetical protein